MQTIKISIPGGNGRMGRTLLNEILSKNNLTIGNSTCLTEDKEKGLDLGILAGKDKGKTGEILEINRSSKRVKVKSINMIKKHLKPTKENKGGIITKENFIHMSNIKNIDKQVAKIKKKEIKK